MIAEPPINDLMKHVDCRYTLVVETAKRARQLVNGAAPLIETDETKAVSIAVQEINRGLIKFSRLEEL